mgnify:CR=1 FL=1
MLIKYKLKKYYKGLSFTLIVLILAIIISIISLITFGIQFYLKQMDGTFPPVVADCPDYWLVESDGDNSLCINVNKLGKGGCQKIKDFSSSRYKGNEGLCRKYKWATRCNIAWDGVTDQIDDPCS